MKTQNKSKLVFGKTEITELNDPQISTVVGGSPIDIKKITDFISDCFSITDRFTTR